MFTKLVARRAIDQRGQGVAFSVPSGVTAHNTCYKCHGPQTEIGGRNIGSCGTCHQLARPARYSDWTKAYSVNFSHAKHVGGRNLNCASCHTIRPGIRSDQVSEPLVSMHFAAANRMSCASCHNNKRAFGPEDFGNCRRCHVGTTFKILSRCEDFRAKLRANRSNLYLIVD
jgi:c(7)-type cytochrome triheme protein